MRNYYTKFKAVVAVVALAAASTAILWAQIFPVATGFTMGDSFTQVKAKLVQSGITVGGLQTLSANAHGNVTLTNGEAIVFNPLTLSGSEIMITKQNVGANPSATNGVIYLVNRTNGVSFLIRSTATNDNATVGYVIINP